jgi:Family of unknown function (DUF5670)
MFLLLTQSGHRLSVTNTTLLTSQAPNNLRIVSIETRSRSRALTVRRSPDGGNRMFLGLGVLLLLLWLGGFFVFHVTAFFIHILLILAVVSIIFHFMRGVASTV